MHVVKEVHIKQSLKIHGSQRSVVILTKNWLATSHKLHVVKLEHTKHSDMLQLKQIPFWSKKYPKEKSHW